MQSGHRPLARALFDNQSESEDELSFRRGDVFTVLQQKPKQLDGWWLCQSIVTGHSGLAPANRLRLLNSALNNEKKSFGLNSFCCHSMSSINSQNKTKNNNQNNNSSTCGGGSGSGSGLCTARTLGLSSSPLQRRKSWNDFQTTTATHSNLHLKDTQRNDLKTGYEDRSNEYDIPVPNTTTNTTSLTLLTSPIEAIDYDFPVISRTTTTTTMREQQWEDTSNENEYDIPVSSRREQTSRQRDSNDVTPLGQCSPVSAQSVSQTGRRLPEEEEEETPRQSVDAIRTLYCKVLSNRAEEDGEDGEEEENNEYDIPVNNRLIESNCRTEAQLNGQSSSSSSSLCLMHTYDRPRLDAQTPPAATGGGNREEQTEKKEEEEANGTGMGTGVLNEEEVMRGLAETETNCLQTLYVLLSDFCFSSEWRARDSLASEERVTQLKRVCHALDACLRALLSVLDACVQSARLVSDDRKMVQKLSELVRQIRVSAAIVDESVKGMDAKHMWTLKALSRPTTAAVADSGAPTTGRVAPPPDECDRLVCCARGLTEDVKHIRAFIQINAKLMFSTGDVRHSSTNQSLQLVQSCRHAQWKPPIGPKPTPVVGQPQQQNSQTGRPLPPLPVQRAESKVRDGDRDWDGDEGEDDDYEDVMHDYVCLESMETQFESKRDNSLKAMFATNSARMPSCQTASASASASASGQADSKDRSEAEVGEEKNGVTAMTSSSKQWFDSQVRECARLLTESIDSLLESIRRNNLLVQKVILLNESKFVVICAQKLLFVSQTIERQKKCKQHQNQNENHIRIPLPAAAQAVSDGGHCLTHSLQQSLKTFVSDVRKASLTGRSFPSAQSVQSVFDSLIDISIQSNRLQQNLQFRERKL